MLTAWQRERERGPNGRQINPGKGAADEQTKKRRNTHTGTGKTKGKRTLCLLCQACELIPGIVVVAAVAPAVLSSACDSESGAKGTQVFCYFYFSATLRLLPSC